MITSSPLFIFEINELVLYVDKLLSTHSNTLSI